MSLKLKGQSKDDHLLSNSKICEPCGWERYQSFFSYELRYGYDHYYQNVGDAEFLFGRDYSKKSINRCTEYKGKLYYYDDEHPFLFSSNLDGSDQCALLKFEEFPRWFAVNRFGIMLITVEERDSCNGNDSFIKVELYEHGGDKKYSIKIMIKDIVDNYVKKYPSFGIDNFYICDNKLFMIVHKQSELPFSPSYLYTSKSAVVIELDTEKKSYKSKVIYEEQLHYPQNPLVDNETVPDYYVMPIQILGSSDFALVYVHYWKPLHENNCDNVEPGAWYYISLKDDRMFCLSNPNNPPEMMLYQPEIYTSYLKSADAEKDWYPIAHFDIKDNLIWIFETIEDAEGRLVLDIVPYDLCPDFYRHRRSDFSIWIDPDYYYTVNDWDDDPRDKYVRFRDLNEHYYFGERNLYFDGKILLSDEDNLLFLNNTGEQHLIKALDGGYTIRNIYVQNGLLFLDNKEAAIGDWVLDLNNPCLDKDRLPTLKKVRRDWRFPGSTDYCGDKLITQFEEEQKRKEEEQEKLYGSLFNSLSSDNDLWDESDFSIDNASAEIQTQNDKTDEMTSQETFIPQDKLDYWSGFGKYLFDKIPTIVKIPKAADRNWYALRLGSSEYRIECSVSTKNQTFRVGFFMKNSDSIYGRAAQHKREIDSIIKSSNSAVPEISWDNSVADANVSVTIPMNGLNKTKQYEIMKDIINGMVEIIDYIDI